MYFDQNVLNGTFEFNHLISEYEESYLKVREDIRNRIGGSLLEIETKEEVRKILTDFYYQNLLDYVLKVTCSIEYLNSPINQRADAFLYQIAKESVLKRVDILPQYSSKRDAISAVIGMYNSYILEINLDFQILVSKIRECDYPKVLKVLKVIKEMKHIYPFLNYKIYELDEEKFNSLIDFTKYILGCKENISDLNIDLAINQKIEELLK